MTPLPETQPEAEDGLDPELVRFLDGEHAKRRQEMESEFVKMRAALQTTTANYDVRINAKAGEMS